MAYAFYLFDRSIKRRCIICNKPLKPGHIHLSKTGNEKLFGNTSSTSGKNAPEYLRAVSSEERSLKRERPGVGQAHHSDLSEYI